MTIRKVNRKRRRVIPASIRIDGRKVAAYRLPRRASDLLALILAGGAR